MATTRRPKALHFYDQITGWFDFQFIYSLAVANASCRSEFLEIGTANGRSTAYLLVDAINSEKDIHINTVDIFGDSLQEAYVRERFADFKQVSIHKASSREYYEANKNKRYDFIFLDGAHDAETVRFELDHFYTQLKPGGIMGGHDYLNTSGDVKEVVDKFCQENRLKLYFNYISFYFYKDGKR